MGPGPPGAGEYRNQAMLGPPGGMQKYPSMQSVHSMMSMGILPPGHGYVPKKIKPDKPYGLSFKTRMNRTHRGPGQKYLKYAAICGGFALLLFLGASVYFGQRNVGRLLVLRTEVLGALMIVAGLCLVSAMGQLIWKARVESNRWRYYVRFRPEGLNTVTVINTEYNPEDDTRMSKLQTGTFGKKALREIPKPKKKKKKDLSKAGSKLSLNTVAEDSAPYTEKSSQQYADRRLPDQRYPEQQYPVQGYPEQPYSDQHHPPPQFTSSPVGTLQQQPGRPSPAFPPYPDGSARPTPPHFKPGVPYQQPMSPAVDSQQMRQPLYSQQPAYSQQQYQQPLYGQEPYQSSQSAPYIASQRAALPTATRIIDGTTDESEL